MRKEKEIYEVKNDPDFQDPYVDIDEWKERVLGDGTRLPYRFIHGGFKKKGVKFSFCFPQKETYKGRFFHFLSPFPGPDEEMASFDKTGEEDKISFALLHGAYFVESNMGSKQMFGGSAEPQLVFKASAAVAEYSRTKAMEIYGCDRPYGYVYGGSGGGYKTMACIENTNAWDGAAPFVIGSPVSLPNTITMHAQGQRVLRNVFGKIVDALDAGGCGNMYEGLNDEEAAMLKELTAMGFPPRAWYPEANGNIDDGSLPVLMPGVKQKDPSYFQEFWTVPGYLGAESAGGVDKDRLQFKGIVKSVHVPGAIEKEKKGLNGVDDAWKKMLTDGKDAWIELEQVPTGEDLYLKGVTISFETGAAVGKQLLLGKIVGNCLVIGMCYGMDDLSSVMGLIQSGDTVVLDNSDYIAVQSYYRHQVPEDLSFHAWDQFRDESGNPTIPQRSNVMGYGYTGTGTVQDGNLQGKVIVTQCLMDESTCPWCGDWYRNKVIETMGDERDFRIYYMDRCMHGGVENTMVTSYVGALNQAILDLSDWVERGIEPLASTSYQLVNGQIIPAETAAERKGMQPVLSMVANGSACAHVKAGEEVTISLKAELPEGAGVITAVKYDFHDNWNLPAADCFPIEGDFQLTSEQGLQGATSSITHVFSEPGTYFVAARVQANRLGNQNASFTQVKNIARVRILVE